MHPTTKLERIKIRRKIYKRRIKQLGLRTDVLYKAYVHQGKPCSCALCANGKYRRALDGKWDGED